MLEGDVPHLVVAQLLAALMGDGPCEMPVEGDGWLAEQRKRSVGVQFGENERRCDLLCLCD